MPTAAANLGRATATTATTSAVIARATTCGTGQGADACATARTQTASATTRAADALMDRTGDNRAAVPQPHESTAPHLAPVPATTSDGAGRSVGGSGFSSDAIMFAEVTTWAARAARSGESANTAIVDEPV